MKKIIEKLRYTEKYKFDYFLHWITFSVGVGLVLIDPVVYISLAIFSLCLHTIKVIKIRFFNKEEQGE